MKVKSAVDPDLKKTSEVRMVDAVRNGMGKMQPYKGKLNDAEIKGSWLTSARRVGERKTRAVRPARANGRIPAAIVSIGSV